VSFINMKDCDINALINVLKGRQCKCPTLTPELIDTIITKKIKIGTYV